MTEHQGRGRGAGSVGERAHKAKKPYRQLQRQCIEWIRFLLSASVV